MRPCGQDACRASTILDNPREGVPSRAASGSPLQPPDRESRRGAGDRDEVQRMLGHASAAMTLDVYAGLFDDELDDVAVG